MALSISDIRDLAAALGRTRIIAMCTEWEDLPLWVHPKADLNGTFTATHAEEGDERIVDGTCHELADGWGVRAELQRQYVDPEPAACPFCGSDDVDPEGVQDDVEDALTFNRPIVPSPPPGGWPQTSKRSICLCCGAIGPLGYVLSGDGSAALVGPSWNDRVGRAA